MSSPESPPQPPQSPQQPNQPHLTLIPSLHPSTLSLSSPALLTTPLTLTLSIHLSNSTSPITVYTGDSFLSSSAQSFNQSDYRLRPLTKGTLCTANVIRRFRGPIIQIADPNAELLELKPGKWAMREVRIGVQEQQHGDNDPASTTNLANLAICATPLSELKVGEEYQIQLAYAPGEWPNHVWWWMEGGKDEIIRDVGKKGPDGLVKLTVEGREVWAVRLMSGSKDVVRVEMGERAVLRVVV